MIVSIHQPNFFPWYPFFQKIQQSDLFVILEHAQFQKNKVQNRFNIGDTWYTMSVNRGLEPINTKKYIYHVNDWDIIKSKLPKYKNILELFDDCIKENLSETNYKILSKIFDLLEIKTKIVFDFPTNLKGSERLLDICLKNNATKYISGISGKKYLNIEKFSEKNIEIIFQKEEEMIKKSILEILYEKHI